MADDGPRTISYCPRPLMPGIEQGVGMPTLSVFPLLQPPRLLDGIFGFPPERC